MTDPDEVRRWRAQLRVIELVTGMLNGHEYPEETVDDFFSIDVADNVRAVLSMLAVYVGRAAALSDQEPTELLSEHALFLSRRLSEEEVS